jgi:FMN phosphatase YigB (HAD superfamily)
MYAKLEFTDAEIEEMHLRLNAEHAARHMWCGLDADAPRVIAGLKAAGLPVGVISNTEDGRLVELLELVELGTHFDFLIDSHVVNLRKPDAAIFNLAL